MCANYLPATGASIRLIFEAPEPDMQFGEVYPGGLAPLIRLDDAGNRITVPAVFGLLPHWAPDLTFARRTYNARSETVATKPSYRRAWARRQFGLAPVQAFFEPNYESGRAVRWRIQRADEAPFALACIWDRWQRPNGEVLESLSLLTVNADRSDLMRRFHRPEDEKRSVVVVPRASAQDWLEAADDATARAWLVPLAGKEYVPEMAPRGAPKPVSEQG
jgi:Uncharacterized conserved protein